MTKTLQDFTDDALLAMAARDRGAGYADVKALRRAAFIAYVAQMPAEPRLLAWAARMTDAHGPLVGLHFHGRHHETSRPEPHGALPWLAALLVVRYGEAPYTLVNKVRTFFWPASWTEDDIDRAGKWELGKQPEGAFSITVEA